METSGAVGIYRVCLGLPLYNEFVGAPTVFVFNFIFYEAYGVSTRIFASCSTALFGRLLTTAILVALAIMIFFVRDEKLKIAESASIALALFSPFVGWWAFALRPDVGGMMFFAMSLITMTHYLRNPGLLLALASAFFVFCSWGFKQPFIFVAPVLLWYMYHKNPQHAFWCLVFLITSMCIPLIVYGVHPYFLHTVYSEARIPWSFDGAVRNFASFAIKSLPVLVLAGLVIATCRKRRWDLE